MIKWLPQNSALPGFAWEANETANWRASKGSDDVEQPSCSGRTAQHAVLKALSTEAQVCPGSRERRP